MSDKKKTLSIGYEDFKRIIDEDCYFVDKTLMIKALLENKASVSLFTRPRRFGKTLNQSMIRRFFEDEITEQGDRVGNGYLFEGFYDEMKGKEYLVKILRLYTVEYTVIARYRGLIKSPIIIVY